jgi:hypothetical protein
MQGTQLISGKMLINGKLVDVSIADGSNRSILPTRRGLDECRPEPNGTWTPSWPQEGGHDPPFRIERSNGIAGGV